MIVILEGANGVGKTTLAKYLCAHLGFAAYKPFREFGDGHWGDRGAMERELERLQIPFNTYVEDMLMADFLARFNPDVLLDRSMPSGIAYGDPPSGAFSLWQRILSVCEVRYIWLRASYAVVVNRSPGRVLGSKRHYELESVFGDLFRRVLFPKLYIDTTHISESDVSKQALQFILDPRRSANART